MPHHVWLHQIAHIASRLLTWVTHADMMTTYPKLSTSSCSSEAGLCQLPCRHLTLCAGRTQGAMCWAQHTFCSRTPKNPSGCLVAASYQLTGLFLVPLCPKTSLKKITALHKMVSQTKYSLTLHPSLHLLLHFGYCLGECCLFMYWHLLLALFLLAAPKEVVVTQTVSPSSFPAVAHLSSCPVGWLPLSQLELV